MSIIQENEWVKENDYGWAFAIAGIALAAYFYGWGGAGCALLASCRIVTRARIG